MPGGIEFCRIRTPETKRAPNSIQKAHETSALGDSTLCASRACYEMDMSIGVGEKDIVLDT